MLSILLVVVVAWVVTCAAGLAIIGWLPTTRHRSIVLPALPLVGVVALVVGLSLTCLIFRLGVGLVVVASLLGVSAVLSVRSGRMTFEPTSVRRFLAALAVGTLSLFFALLPLLRAGRLTLIQPTSNNDAFSYVTVTSWLEGHTALDRPKVAQDPPVYGYTRAHLRIGLRLGEELVQGAVAEVVHVDPARSWYVVESFWALLIPGGVVAAASLLELDPVIGFVAGLVSSCSALVLYQVYNQNSAAVLGMAMVSPILAMLASLAFDLPTALPPSAVGLGLAAFAGTYTESLPLIVPVMTITVLAQGLRARRRVMKSVATAALTSVALGPFIWWNAARSLLSVGGSSIRGTVSAYAGQPLGSILAHYLGVASPERVARLGISGTVLSAAVTVGVCLALTITRFRVVWLSVVVVIAGLVFYLQYLRDFLYGQQRAITTSQPLILLISVIGLAALVASLCRRTALITSRAIRQIVGIMMTLVLVILGAIFLRANLGTSRTVLNDHPVQGRTIDSALLAGSRWMHRAGGPAGRDITVVSSLLFEQLWLEYEARDLPQASFAFLYPDYNDLPAPDLIAPHLRRYALVSRDEYVQADPQALVSGDDRFQYGWPTG